jgi:hypothetical protein
MHTHDQQYPDLLATLANDEPTTSYSKVTEALGEKFTDVNGMHIPVCPYECGQKRGA